MAVLEQAPTAYDILGVHPSAPTELLSACYWAATSDLQKKRATEPAADAALHRLTRAYELVSDPVRRAGYNLSIAYTGEPLAKRALPRRRSLLRRLFGRDRVGFKWSVDPYEVLGLHPSVHQSAVAIAYRTMRDVYLRLPPGSRNRETLLKLLDESYAILADPQKRAELAGAGAVNGHEPAAPARNDPPGPSQPDPAEAMAAPSITDPPRAGVPRPPETPSPVHAEPGADVASTRARPPAAIAERDAGAAGSGLRRFIGAIAASSVVAARGVASAVRWTALTVAALLVAAARFIGRSVRSGWPAGRGWLRRYREGRRRAGADRSDEATATPDEVFLGRLASSVGESKTESGQPSDETTRR
jgi:curved DNA-binding protein CbpA